MLIRMNDQAAMKIALSLARKASGKTSPNPMVGAVIFRSERVISKAYHMKAGTPHAEALALAEAGDKARGATLYVTLEPCCHTNKRTPPCTSAIIDSGIKRVVVAMQDPNPLVSGQGISLLKRAGIIVDCGLMEDEARELNYAYIKHISTGQPYVTLKMAMTLDGKIATSSGQSRWITGEKARKVVHRMRSDTDAILTAIGTVKADDPEFTSRIRGGVDPVRVIIDPDLDIPVRSRVLSTPPDTIIVTNKSGPKAARLEKNGIRLLSYKGKKLSLNWLMRELGSMGISSVMAEGGASFNWHMIEEGVVDRMVLFMAPKMIGGKDAFPVVGGKGFRRLEDAVRLTGIRTRRVGEDIMITAKVAGPQTS